MSLYGRVFAALYDRTLAETEAAGLRDRRAALVGQAGGRVLEVGAGTVLNLAHYAPAVEELVLTEPEAPMAARLRDRLAASSASAPARVVEAPAEALPFPAATFDTVVATLVLCTVGDPDAALGEIRRVLRPDGRLLVLEHVRAPEADVARRQDRLTPVWRHVGHGCHPNRDTAAALARTGFETGALRRGRLPKAPRFIRPTLEGVATPVS